MLISVYRLLIHISGEFVYELFCINGAFECSPAMSGSVMFERINRLVGTVTTLQVLHLPNIFTTTTFASVESALTPGLVDNMRELVRSRVTLATDFVDHWRSQVDYWCV